jgi:hypothetical protein
MDLIQQEVFGLLVVAVLVETFQVTLQLPVLVVLVQQLEHLGLVLVVEIHLLEMDLPQ